MNTMFERETLEERQESEVTLSTGSLLAIFFGLVVVCGVFFGFGYSMGRHASDTRAAVQAAASQVDEAPAAIAARAKPSATENLRAEPRGTATAEDDTAPRTVVVDESASQSVAATRPEKKVPVEEARQEVAPPAKSKPAPKLVAAIPAAAPRSVLPSASMPAKLPGKAASTGVTMVQIAAVSHPDDAQALVAALKKRGYAVSLRSEPQDKLIHVQVGPFASHVDAVAMRQKLLADGYNAIIK